MVSFFGLKLGSDRKKSQSKQSDKKPQQWTPTHQADLPTPTDFAHNFSRPQRMSSRPGTSYSIQAPATNWRAPYMGGAASSSMVELTAPSARRPSLSSLRLVGSDADMKARVGDAALPSPALRSPLAAGGSRPGTGMSGKTEWVNPLDVHFGRDLPAGQGTVSGEGTAARKRALSQFVFGLPSFGGDSKAVDDSSGQEKATLAQLSGKTVAQTPSLHGYPSPPLSITNGDTLFAPSSTETRPSSSRHAPSALRNVDTAAPISPPSPPASEQLASPHHEASESESEAEPEPAPAPVVIRNVQAKRDTMWYHTPRRRSFTMEVDEEELARRREERRRLGEGGFAGNFAAFDFGETVKGGSVDVEGEMSAAEVRKGGRAVVERTESPLGLWKQTSATSERTETSLQHSLDSAESPFGTRSRPVWDKVDSPSGLTRTTPTPEQRRDPRDRGMSGSTSNEPVASNQSNQLRPSTAIRSVESPAPLSLSARRAAPRPATSAGPSTGTGLKDASHTFGGPLDGTDPNARSRPPPRPFRPPPAALSLSAERPDTAIRSPYGPPVDDDSYMRTDAAPAPPGRSSARPPASPYGRPPVEAGFPVMKGLPRGRRPESPYVAVETFTRDPFDRSSPRRSAIPAPLSPRAPPPSWTSPATSSPISSTAPRLPSPEFPSLEKSLSFDLGVFDGALASPVLSEFGLGPRSDSPSGRRVDAKRAPPRPSPITLPPTANDGSKVAQQEFGMRSPVTETARFI